MTSIEVLGRRWQGPGQVGTGEGTSERQILWEVLIHEDEKPGWRILRSCMNLQFGVLKAV